MKIKSPFKLVVSIFTAQSAGIIGSFFTINAIPTWYVFLNKPSFSPPNWLFGPVWTILYTLIGISFYKVWINSKKKTSFELRFFLFHLFLNAIWSIIFFGIKDLGLAFLEIVVVWATIVYMIIIFKKIDILASYLLIPYLLWVSFATILNFSIWQLNPDNNNVQVFAQELTTQKAFEDLLYSRDMYQTSLTDFNLKKDSYLKNQTLSHKEEVRLALYDLLIKRNDYKRSYLTVIRTRTAELTGITEDEKRLIFTKVDPEVVWLENRKNEVNKGDSLEDLLNKAREEDSRYETDTLPIIHLALSNISLSTIIEIKNSHKDLYEKLKSEANNLVRLGRADPTLFDRWFKDIDLELAKIGKVEDSTRIKIKKIFDEDKDNYEIGVMYQKVTETLEPARENLLTLNNFITELESLIEEKR